MLKHRDYAFNLLECVYESELANSLLKGKTKIKKQFRLVARSHFAKEINAFLSQTK